VYNLFRNIMLISRYILHMEEDLRLKRTKIVATIGPASEEQSVLVSMILSGMNVARFNFSHGEHEWHKSVMTNVRKASEEVNRSVAILADIQGPHIRTRMLEPLDIKKGDVVRIFDASAPKKLIEQVREECSVIVIDCPHMIPNLCVDHEIYIEDGLMRLRVTDVVETHAVAQVMAGGTVRDHKGVNIPDAQIPLPAMTPKDVDYVAISFVRSAQDIADLRQHMQKLLQGKKRIPKIVAKIERKEAIENLEQIIAVVDVVMVARGDLGIETDQASITLVQKDIVAKSLQYMKPVIVATQMLVSMKHNPRPTRAEISDVTNAVIDHTDATMLSGETSVGTFPVESVKTMARIAHATEESQYDDLVGDVSTTLDSEEVHVARSAYAFTREMDAKAVVIYSESGYTAQVLSHFRPERMILVATTQTKVYRQLSLVWGVIPYLFDRTQSRAECVDSLIVQATEEKLLHKSEIVITVLGSTKEGKKLVLKGSRIV
jgi:pyruvate kinase